MTTTLHHKFAELSRTSQAINLRQYWSVGTIKYRTLIHRDSYDDQSYGLVEMFMLGQGWREVFRVQIDFLDNAREMSYVQVPRRDQDHPDYQFKHDSALLRLNEDAEKMLSTWLDIMG